MRRTLVGLTAAILVAGCGGGSAPTRTVTVTRTPSQTSAAPAAAAPRPATAKRDPAAIVRQLGYTPGSSSAGKPLDVVLATRTGSADGTAQRAFFFWNGRYLGTDAADDSAGIRLDSSSGDTVTLSYRLYRPKDPQCCATGGSATVRYRFTGGRLVPLDPIPPSGYGASGSRR